MQIELKIDIKCENRLKALAILDDFLGRMNYDEDKIEGFMQALLGFLAGCAEEEG